MTGPATKMYEALHRIENDTEDQDAVRTAAIGKGAITEAELEAMDAAAEVMSLESGRVKIDGAITSSTPAAIVDVGGQLLWLEPNDEQSLLAVLLRREVQRRKEAADHA